MDVRSSLWKPTLQYSNASPKFLPSIYQQKNFLLQLVCYFISFCQSRKIWNSIQCCFVQSRLMPLCVKVDSEQFSCSCLVITMFTNMSLWFSLFSLKSFAFQSVHLSSESGSPSFTELEVFSTPSAQPATLVHCVLVLRLDMFTQCSSVLCFVLTETAWILPNLLQCESLLCIDRCAV